MKFDYENALNGVLQANNVNAAIAELYKFDEISYITFHLINGYHDKGDNPFVRTNYPPVWVSHYLLNNLVQKDPILRFAATATKPFCWSSVPLDPAGLAFMAEAVGFGLGGSGYSVPHQDDLRRRSVLSINSELTGEDWGAFLSEHADNLHHLAHDLHVKGVSEAFSAAGSVPALSPREHQCLELTAKGKSHTDIAIILDLSEHTIRSYLKVARIKLDSVTLAQAVSKATHMGLL